MNKLRFLAFGFVCASVVSAHAQALGVAGNFNDFILGDATQSNVDAQGLYAVGGNANFTNMSVNSGNNALYSGWGTVVGGNYTNIYATMNGGIFAGGGFSATDPTINGNIASNGSVNLSNFGTVHGSVTYGTTYTNPNTGITGTASHGSTASPIDFGATGTFLHNLSSSLAAIGANGVTNSSGSNLSLTGSNSSLDIFSVTAAQLSASTNLVISAPTSATVIVNIIGTSASLSGGLSLVGVTADHVLYNFSNATSLTMSGIGVEGTILAPGSALNFSSGDIDGEIIADSLTGSVESHEKQFDGQLPPSGSPEPVTLGMSAFLAGAWLRKRLKKA
jgi:choice-of-anchor A domain-containing protein